MVAIVSPLFIMYSTSGCFAIAARNFDELGEADIVLCTLDCIRENVFGATMFEIVPRFHLVESYLMEKQFAANVIMFTVGVRLLTSQFSSLVPVAQEKALLAY